VLYMHTYMQDNVYVSRTMHPGCMIIKTYTYRVFESLLEREGAGVCARENNSLTLTRCKVTRSMIELHPTKI
jgi:hypothetical protein